MNDNPEVLKFHNLKVYESVNPSPTFDPFTADSGVWGVWEDGDYVLAFGLPLPGYTLRYIAQRLTLPYGYPAYKSVEKATVQGQRVRLILRTCPNAKALTITLAEIKDRAYDLSKVAKAGWTPEVEPEEPKFVQGSLF